MTDKGQSTNKTVIHVFHFQHGEPMIPVPHLSAGMKVQLAFSIVTPHGLQAVRRNLSSVVRYQGKLTTTFQGELRMFRAVPCRAVPCRVVPYRVVPCCAVPCRAVPCRVVPYRAVLCCAVPCRAVPCCAVLCCTVLCCTVPCRAVPCCAVPCRAAQRCAVPCRAVLCCAVLCCAVLCRAVPCRTVPCRAVLCCIVSIGLRCVASSNVTEESSWIIKTSKEPKKLFLICGFDDMTL